MTSTRSAFEAAGKVFRQEGISRRVREITISAIKEMPLLAAKIPGCVSLGQGIPSFTTPAHILEAAREALLTNPAVGKYTLGPGLPELKEAVAAELARSRGVKADPETEICITVGAMEGLLAGILCLVEPGDEVILPSPNYASHIEQVILAGGRPVFAPLEEGTWALDPERVRAAVTGRTKAVILCSPHNPTGAVFEEEALRAVAALALERNLLLILDEAYDFLVYDGRPFFSLTSLPELKENLLAAFSFSKKYAMTGFRAGFVHASAGIMDHLLKVHDAGAICAPTVSQYAALAALKGPQDCVEEFRRTLEKRRDLACTRLEAMGGQFSLVRPAGSYYLFPGWRDRKRVRDSMELALRLLKEARVITIPGIAFGPTGEHHLRMCYGGTEEEINLAFDRIEGWTQKELS